MTSPVNKWALVLLLLPLGMAHGDFKSMKSIEDFKMNGVWVNSENVEVLDIDIEDNIDFKCMNSRGVFLKTWNDDDRREKLIEIKKICIRKVTPSPLFRSIAEPMKYKKSEADDGSGKKPKWDQE